MTSNVLGDLEGRQETARELALNHIHRTIRYGIYVCRVRAVSRLPLHDDLQVGEKD
jgi:hypothetical protein